MSFWSRLFGARMKYRDAVGVTGKIRRSGRIATATQVSGTDSNSIPHPYSKENENELE